MVESAALEVPMEMLALQWIATYAIHSTVLILSVWVATKLFRWMSLSTQESLWKAALMGGAVTASLQMLIGLQSPWGAVALPAELDTAPIAIVETATAPTEAVDVERRIVKHRTGDMTITTVRERKPVAAAPVVTTSRQTLPGSPWPWVLLGFAAVGSAFCVGRLLVASRRLRQQLGERREVVEDPLLENFLTLCDTAGLSREDKKDKKKRPMLKLMASANIRSPLALRREIVVPERAIVELTAPQQKAMLAHEMAHVVRKDPLWRMVAASVEALFFFQPLNILARNKMQEVAEFQADEWAAETTGSGAHLAKAIAAVAGWVERGHKETPLAATMAGGGSSIIRRVRRLTRFSSKTPGASKGWFAARLGSVLVLLGGVMWLAPGIGRAEVRTNSDADLVRDQAENPLLASAIAQRDGDGGDVVFFREVETEDGTSKAQVRVETDEETVRVDIERDPTPPPPEPESSSSVRIIIGGSLDPFGWGEGFGYLDINIDDDDFEVELEDLEEELEEMFEPGFPFSRRHHHEARHRMRGRAARAQARAHRVKERALERAERARDRAFERAERARDRAEQARDRAERAPEDGSGIYEL